MQSFDVLVIGGGAAGVAAALAAAGRGRTIGLIRPAPGVTALAAGGWRGPLPDRLRAALADAGLPHEPVDAPLPHPSGTLQRYDAAPAGHAAAAPEDGTLVCGIAGLPGFLASPLARLWGDEAGATLVARTLEPAWEEPAAGWSPVALAAALDREPGPLADALADAARKTGAARALLPPVLGLERPHAVRTALEQAAGVPVGETLAAPPASVPGWRLDRALLRALEDAGVAVIRARVVDRTAENGRIVELRMRTAVNGAPSADADSTPISAAAFVLATGKFAGRGLEANGDLREAALGCPVWIEHLERIWETADDPRRLTHADPGLPQPLLRAGVRTDGEGRPVNRWGDVVYENVRVAGSLREGASAAGLGLGAAAEQGARAGTASAEAAA